MLGNLLDGLEAASAPVQRVIIYQGFKIYGIHLGAKVPTPARESDPPHMPPISTRRRKPRCVLGRSAASGTMSRSDRTSWWVIYGATR
jgi:hypothetical protein